MASKNPVDNTDKEYIRAARSIALSMAALSVALAAFCLALLSFSNQYKPDAQVLDKFVPITLLTLGTVFIFTSALSLDWVVDSFKPADWKAIIGNNPSPDPARFDQILVRFNLFNHGYFILCIGIATLSFIILLQGIHEVASDNTGFYYIALLFALVWSVYIVCQMMTLETIRASYGLFIFAMLLGSIFGAVMVTKFG
jgi:hypothetical protein